MEVLGMNLSPRLAAALEKETMAQNATPTLQRPIRDKIIALRDDKAFGLGPGCYITVEHLKWLR